MSAQNTAASSNHKITQHQEAISRCIEALGFENVATDEETLQKYARTTGDKGTKPLAILFPISTVEVQKIVRIANLYALPVHPISRGKNWGYGDACAPSDSQVIIDFRRMNRILKVDTRLAYTIIEPGVTQGQLSSYLQSHKTGLWMDATGAGPHASVVGNTLERGYGHTHYGDHFHSLGGMEIVLPNGEILNTGFGHFPQAKAAHVYPYGVGPMLDGIFTQSNLGIVTQMTLHLSPEPEAFLAFISGVDSDEELEDLMERLSYLRLRGVLQSTVHIGNDLRVFSSRTRFPWHLSDEGKHLSEDVRAQLRKKYQAKKWTFTGAIYGTREHVESTRRTIQKHLAPLRLTFLDDQKFQKAEKLHRWMNRVGLGDSKMAESLLQKISTARPLYDLLKGIPTQETLKGSAWRIRGPLPTTEYDPLNAGAGILWQAPVLPATSEDVRHILSVIKPVFEKHGFDCPVTFCMINERALTCVTNVLFDKTNPAEVQKALICHRELGEKLAESGYYAYRGSTQSIQKLHSIQTPYWRALQAIKKALDPLGIISPGHYIPNSSDDSKG